MTKYSKAINQEDNKKSDNWSNQKLIRVSPSTSDIKEQQYRELWRPAKISVSSPQETYKPYPLLKVNLPNYPRTPLPQPWGVSVIPEIKLACPVYPHPPDLSTFTTKASLVLTKYYENHMRADPSSQKTTL